MNPELHYKGKLEEFYQEKINNIIIRGKCDWYEDWKKSFKFFVDLEKRHAIQNQIRTISCDKKEITDEREIIKKVFKFYKALFQKNQRLKKLIQTYLNKIKIPELTIDQSQKCGGVIN